MITLMNCILKNAGGRYSRLQDNEGQIDISVFHRDSFSEKNLKVIWRVAMSETGTAWLSRKSSLQQALEDDDPNGAEEVNFTVTHYSKYLHDSGRTSFMICLGEKPEYFGFLRARAEFLHAEEIVKDNWGLQTRYEGDWTLYSLTKPPKTRFAIIACNTKLTTEEIFIIIQGYLTSMKDPCSNEVMIERVNAAISRMAKVNWEDEKVNLPEAQSIHDGSALLEIVVANDRNYFLAEN